MPDEKQGERSEATVHHGSIWPFVVGFGAAIGYAGLVTGIGILLLGLVIFVVGLVGWLAVDLRTPSRAYYGELPALPGVARVSARKLGTWLFLATEIMFFTVIIGASWNVRMRTGNWAVPGEILNVPLTGINTFILIVSSFTMVLALDGIRRGSQARLRWFLFATMALGATFLGIQVYEYGQSELGRIISVDLPDLGDKVEKGEPFAEVESQATSTELIAPVSGTVVAVNPELEGHPSIINEDPYNYGWLIEVRLKDQSEVQSLMDMDEYYHFVFKPGS